MRPIKCPEDFIKGLEALKRYHQDSPTIKFRNAPEDKDLKKSIRKDEKNN